MKRAPASIEKALKLFETNQLSAALKEGMAFLQARPDHFDALQLCGAICSDFGRHEAALRYLSHAARLYPHSAAAQHNLGNAQMTAGQSAEALRSFSAGLKIEPRLPLLLCASANALTELDRYEDALAQFKSTISVDPNFADAHYGLGRVLLLKNDFASAKAAFLRAVRLDARDRKALVNAFHCGLEIADWQDFDKLSIASRAAALDGSIETPFRAMLLFDETKTHARGAKGVLEARRSPRPLTHRPSRAGDRIRVGYFSADFRSHPTSRLLAGLIEQHDRNAFEVVGISIGGGSGASGPLGQRIRDAFDTFVDMADATTGAIRDKASELGIDIAIDLMGHTKYSRPELFRPRLARVQVNYLGYPGPSGNPEMDYIIVDPFVAETFEAQQFTEQPAILPDCYQPNDDRRPPPAATRSRAEYGLPETGVVFCCFNEARKITPQVFDSWMRVLGSTPSSVLWLYVPLEETAANLRAEAVKRGIDPTRLIFCGRVDHAEHLARYGAADLFLDTFPYTAHTTASDALWAGCPVLTRVGVSFPTRVAGSILATYGLPELITRSEAEFESIACRLVSNPAELRAIRDRIKPCDAKSVLFETKRYAVGFEAALQAMWARSLAGKKPGRIVVQPVHATAPVAALDSI